MVLNPPTGSVDGWFPIRVYWRGQEPWVDWCRLDDSRFTHAFFDTTIQAGLCRPFNLLFRPQTPLRFLGEMYEQCAAREPDGFIFHMSRCGSTLVSQMLAAVPENIVISEAMPIDAVIRAHLRNEQLTIDDRIKWLRWMVSALGRDRDRQGRYFIKFDSWNTLDMDLITAAYPDVPWVFLFREPEEVMVSQMRNRGAQMVPGVVDKRLPGLGLSESIHLSEEEYCARVLAAICESALRHAGSPRGIFINYASLPEAAVSTILKHFDISFSLAEIELMRAASQFDAKSREVPFTPDTRAKRAAATDAVKRAASTLGPLYRQMNELAAAV